MPWKVHFEDECPFPQVGYVNFLDINYLLNWEPILQARRCWHCLGRQVFFWDQTLYTLIATLFARHSKNGKSFIHVIHVIHLLITIGTTHFWKGISGQHNQAFAESLLILQVQCTNQWFNWWFGARWFGLLGSAKMKGLVTRRYPQNPKPPT